MSDDMTDDVDLARTDWSYPIAVDLDDNPWRFDNPLVKGLIVLLMVAVAGTVLVATDDDQTSIAASADLDSEPLAPEVAEAPATSVQAVASDTASSGSEQADDTTQSWTDAASAVGQSMSAERLRQQAIADRTTTTAPTTTAAPTTAAPTTAAPTTAPAATSTDESAVTGTEDTTTTVADGTSGESTSSTDTTTDESTTTTVTETTETTVAETTTTAPAETTTTVAGGDGWVDTGNGVLVPPVLLAIRWCESRDDYQAANPSSSARGAYQFLSGSWRAYGHADRYGVSTADQASRAQQDEAALLTWERDGTRPWNASRTCWSQRI